VSSNPGRGEVYSIQHHDILQYDNNNYNMTLKCDRSLIIFSFPGNGTTNIHIINCTSSHSYDVHVTSSKLKCKTFREYVLEKTVGASSLKLWVRIPVVARCTRYSIMWYSLSVTCNRSVFFLRVIRFPPPIKVIQLKSSFSICRQNMQFIFCKNGWLKGV
jgi:hypothetical protein